MTAAEAATWLEFCRKRTVGLLDEIEKMPDAGVVLGWRPGPGRAHIAWQLMHIAATDDRHLGVRMKGGDPAEAEYVRRFAGGSVPDDATPTIAEIRRYLAERRQALLGHLATVADFSIKPNDKAPWVYEEWIRVLTWHESHHHGQAHLTLNLFKAAHPGA